MTTLEKVPKGWLWLQLFSLADVCLEMVCRN